MNKCMYLAERNNIPQTLVVGTLCFLEDIELGCITSSCIEEVCIHQEPNRPQPFCTLLAEGTEDELELTYAVS